jgi:Skp family chaperone for outer membrane proteins
VKRVYLFLAALVGLGGVVYVAGQVKAQGPAAGAGSGTAATAPARQDPPRVAVFNVAKLMKEFQKWQYFAVTMNNERIQAAGELLKIKTDIDRMKEELLKTTEKAKIDALQKATTEKMRLFEDRETFYKNELDGKAAKHLKDLFADVNAAVSSIVEANGYDIVFAYPEATTQQDSESQLYIDMKMRPPAAMPFYVSKRIDITDVMIATLNTHRKAPGPIPTQLPAPGQTDIKTTGGTTIPTPGGTGR